VVAGFDHPAATSPAEIDSDTSRSAGSVPVGYRNETSSAASVANPDGPDRSAASGALPVTAR
jgi:hypothetical protein